LARPLPPREVSGGCRRALLHTRRRREFLSRRRVTFSSALPL